MAGIHSRIVTYKSGEEHIRKIRENVFVKEQGVPADIEIDGLDPVARHVLVFDAEEVIGTGRMLLDGHIGRIAVKKHYRGKGIGTIIINELVRVSKTGTIIKIITPHFSSLKSWIDPTHFHHLSYFSFDHFEKSENPQNYIGNGIRVHHKNLSFGGGFLGLTARLIFKLSPKRYEQKYCFIFRASTLTFDIEVL